jgi:hypothetical protein
MGPLLKNVERRQWQIAIEDLNSALIGVARHLEARDRQVRHAFGPDKVTSRGHHHQLMQANVAGLVLALVGSESGRPPASGKGSGMWLSRRADCATSIEQRVQRPEYRDMRSIVTIGPMVQR